MKQHPLVTIGILSYNTGKLVVESMGCIPKQQYPNLEIIIIDDCSSDGVSADLIQKHIDAQQLNCLFIRNNENKGISHNLNEIVKRASNDSKYLVLLGDDLWDDDFLRSSIDIMENSAPNEIMLYSDVRLMYYDTKEVFFESDSTTIHPESENSQKLFSHCVNDVYHLNNSDFLEFLFETNPIFAIGVVYKTALMKREGGFCTNYFFEDYPTWFKFAKAGYDFLYYHKTLTTYVRHGKNLTYTKGKEILDVIDRLKIENIAYCKQPYTLKKVVPQLLYNYPQPGWVSFAKFKLLLILVFRNKRIIPILFSLLWSKISRKGQ